MMGTITLAVEVDVKNNPIEEKKELILAHEESTANQLARRVLDKPTPSVWMILIPVFFVFNAFKIKEYSQGLKNFSANYLISRHRALETAVAAEKRGVPPEITQLMEQVDSIPVEAQSCFRAWMTLLIDHYSALLSVSGKSYSELIRAHYRNKLSYSQFHDQLGTIENAFNMSLFSGLEGDAQDLLYTLDRMKKGLADLRQKEIEEIFS